MSKHSLNLDTNRHVEGHSPSLAFEDESGAFDMSLHSWL